MKKTKIDLNELPEWSAWPERIFGFTPWEIKKRTTEKNNQEYDKEKYLQCVEEYERTLSKMTVDEIKSFELGVLHERVCVSYGEELFVMNEQDAINDYYERLEELVLPHIQKAGTVVELASGYGYNLSRIKGKSQIADVNYLGGEYSVNAVSLAGRLFADTPEIRVVPFDFYQTPYQLLSTTTGPLTIFTVYGTQQLPNAIAVIEGLRPYRERIHRVIFVESVYELTGDTLLGMLRKRYIELCNYNTDMLALLENSPDIEIFSVTANTIGLNPLLPASVIEWKFK